jgi:O-antigen ligase
VNGAEQNHARRGATGPLWLWLALLAVLLALLGGSARPDPVQNAALRPLAALLLIPAVVGLRAGDLIAVRVPLAAGGALLAWMVIQLVPLPPAMWQALPGRDLVAALDRVAGLEGLWRPIALAPFRGLDSLMAMLVPLVAVLLAASGKIRTSAILVAIAGLGAANAVLGILQVIGGPGNPFHLYALTNRGASTGIFANENHAAVFAAVVLLVLARLAVSVHPAPSQGLPKAAKLALGPLYLLVVLGVLIGGSRAGVASAVLAMIAGAAMAGIAWRGRGRRARSGGDRLPVLLAAGVAGIALLVCLFLFLGRAPAAKDLLASGAIDDIRWSLWPVLADMARDHWLVGTGFGSFEAVYRIYEPDALLLPAYVNQAHNDWAQLVIEGGLPATLCLLVVTGWVGSAILTLWRRSGREARGLAIFWTAWLAILMAASLVDYPLRTPTFQAATMWLLVCLARDRGKRGAAGRGVDDLRKAGR